MQEIGKTPVLSFGNSSGDSAMHNFCLGNEKYKTEAFMVLADNYDHDHADRVETEKRQAAWEKAGYAIFSMNDDFKTIYGEEVEKVDFTWSQADVNQVNYENFNEAATAAVASTYTSANLTILYESHDDKGDSSKEPAVINDTYNLTATYDTSSNEWTINTEDAALFHYNYYLNNQAKDIKSQDEMFDPTVYQSNIANYYLGTNLYRYRFNASGETNIPDPGLSFSVTYKGDRLFNQYGLCDYSEEFTVMTEATTKRVISSSTIVFISYQ